MIGIIVPDISRCGVVPFSPPDAPVLECRRAALEVEVLCEGQDETLIQAPLIEVKCCFERMRIMCDQGRTGEDDSGMNSD